MRNLFCLIFLFSSLSFFSAQAQSARGCDEIANLKVKLELRENNGNSDLILKFETAPNIGFTIMITDPDQNSKVYQSTKHEFLNVKSGAYTIYLIDKQGCSKQLNFKVK